MNSPKNIQPEKEDAERNIETGIDALEEMWDAMLAKGDDEYQESATRHRKENDASESQAAKPARRRGKRL